MCVRVIRRSLLLCTDRVVEHQYHSGWHPGILPSLITKLSYSTRAIMVISAYIPAKGPGALDIGTGHGDKHNLLVSTWGWIPGRHDQELLKLFLSLKYCLVTQQLFLISDQCCYRNVRGSNIYAL